MPEFSFCADLLDIGKGVRLKNIIIRGANLVLFDSLFIAPDDH